MSIANFFSIIIPIYKVEKYLRQCVDSIINQDFDNYEIILVDDGSPDRCPAICDEYSVKSEKVKVVHKPNGGLSDARNAGVAIATGKYVTFVDSDDFWRNNDVLSGICRVIESNNNPDIVVSDFIKYYDKTNKFLEPPVVCTESINGKPKQEVLEYLYFQHADMKMSACQKFVKRDLLTESLFEKGLLSEDIDWSLKIYPKAQSICVYSMPYYCYRQQREGSICNTASVRSFDCIMHIIDKWSNEIPSLDIPDGEKSIYLGYLAYQLSICMTFYLRLQNVPDIDFLNRIKTYKELFNQRLNHKTRKVNLLIKTLGIRNASILLSLMLKLRSVLKLG